jgi:hypothetical protein
MSDADKDDPEEAPWQRLRRLRLDQIAAETEHGRQLAERYDHAAPRPGYAAGGYAKLKRRRR